MRGKRKDRDTAMREILGLMHEHPGTRFKPSFLASTLQIGRERTAGLLQSLQSEGKVSFDGAGWFASLANQDVREVRNGSDDNAGTSWIVIGYIGNPPKITIGFES